MLNIFYAIGNLPGDASAIANRFLLLEILRVKIYFLCYEYYYSNCSTFIAPLFLLHYTPLHYDLIASIWSDLSTLCLYSVPPCFPPISFTLLQFSLLAPLSSYLNAHIFFLCLCSIQLCSLNYFSLYSALIYQIFLLGIALSFAPRDIILLRITYH